MHWIEDQLNAEQYYSHGSDTLLQWGKCLCQSTYMKMKKKSMSWVSCLCGDINLSVIHNKIPFQQTYFQLDYILTLWKALCKALVHNV